MVIYSEAVYIDVGNDMSIRQVHVMTKQANKYYILVYMRRLFDVQHIM